MSNCFYLIGGGLAKDGAGSDRGERLAESYFSPKQSSHEGKTFFQKIHGGFPKTDVLPVCELNFRDFLFCCVLCVFVGDALKIAVLLAWEFKSGEFD